MTIPADPLYQHLLLTAESCLFAKSLSCDSPSLTTGSPCLVCKPCIAIEENKSASYIEVDAPRLRTVGELDEVITRAMEAPLGPEEHRTFVIDEAHALSNPNYRESCDFLLKRLEEPPKNVAFCFATTSPEKVPPALRSRCHSLPKIDRDQPAAAAPSNRET
jgi:DNA polymerase-3 subunit gamma/tau